MPLARFIALHERSEPEAAASARFAVVLAHEPRGVVLVFNLYRQVWELPGGLIDPGENAREAAARECFEEAGCRPGPLDWLGLVEVHDGATHLGAVYQGGVERASESHVSEETGGVAFWTPRSSPHPLGETDAALLARFGAPLAKSPA